MDYSGKIITKNAVTPTQTAASGVWTLDDALQAQKGNNWPIPGVPNPISKSLRFNSADSAYLNRTPAIASNRRTWTWSGWIKRSALSSGTFFAAGDGTAGNRAAIDFDSDQVRVIFGDGTSALASTQVFRDPSAWYHFVFAIDTTQATASNRVKMYVNGSQITAFSTASYPAQNYDTFVNNTNLHTLGARYRTSVDDYFNGYMTELNFIDGQALTPSDFGMTDTNTGVWIPKKYTGTYGTNGFYVNFKDATNTTTIGYDYSGNGNNWNANNFSVTAGAGNDSLTDVPTPWVGYSVNGDTGGVVRGNYATLNPIASLPGGTGSATWSNGNLNFAPNQAEGSAQITAVSTIICPSSGKWYWEVTPTTLATASSSRSQIGIMNVAALNNTFTSAASTTGAYAYVPDGSKTSSPSNTVYTGYGASYTTNDVIGVALNMDAGTLTFYKNGVSQGTAFSGLSGEYFPAVGFWITAVINFGQRPFAYTPPAGFLSLCTTNLPTPTIGATSSTRADDYFNTVLYTGDSNSTGATRSVTGVGFQPDFVWIKTRTDPYSHQLYDAVRGTGSSKNLQSDQTSAEGNLASLYGYVSAFQTDGFQTTNGTDGANSGIWVNALNENFVAWNWKANGAGSSNTQGTITSTVSANTTAGFSIVTYTGNGGNASATIGHGLGAVPKMMILKFRNTTSAWSVYHASIGNTKRLTLNTTDAESTDSTYWNNTTPTSTVFTVGSAFNQNTPFNYLVYCFTDVPGYSAFGSYTGNGSTDGPFIYTGFRPRFLMVKLSSTGTESWQIVDTSRDPYNVSSKALFPNLSNAEVDASSVNRDILSNGFKIRSSDTNQNGNGSTYIYAAFAESPFKFANAR